MRWSNWVLASTLLVQGSLFVSALLWAAASGRVEGDSGGPGPALLAFIGVIEILASGYVVWAGYWGVPAVWRWWRKSAARSLERWLPPWSPATFIPYIALYSSLLGIGLFYGAVGGGFYQYFRHRRIARTHGRGPN